jgi:IMP dehydrogenase
MIVVDGATYKEDRGMASREAGSPYVEGVSGLVPAKGPAIEVIKAMCAGLASTCSYVGADSLGDLSKKAVFVESLHSNSIIGESNVHDIVMNR